jgi:hypothetical protein
MSGERPRNVSTHQRRPSNDSKLPNPPLSPSVESGFEGTVARGPKPGPREQNGQVEKKKDKPARAGFSFAAAAAGGLLDEDEGEGEWVSEETNGDVNGVNGVTEKVGEVEL